MIRNGKIFDSKEVRENEKVDFRYFGSDFIGNIG